MPLPSPPVAEIPDFLLIRPIGSGSYGEVWLARSVTGAYRAIKIVRRDRFDSERTFEREFRGIEAFEPVSRTHGNLLQVLHVGRNEAAGFYFYVMELADDATGAPISDPDAYAPKTLRSVVRTGDRLPVSEAVRIGCELASGLAHLHDLGLVHRDIKPTNIVLVNSIAKLGDAGLVAHSREDMSIVGTEGYVPPEGMGSPPADLYSLGMVLYEISTGMRRQDFPEIPADLPSREDNALFMQLNAVVLKACDPKPSRRFKTAGHLLAALERIQPDEHGNEQTHSLFGRKRLLWSVAMAVVFMLVLAFSGAALFKRFAPKWKRNPQGATPALVTAPSLSPRTEEEVDNIPSPVTTKNLIPPPEDDSSGDTPTSSLNQRTLEPMPVKTITTESADEFLRP